MDCQQSQGPFLLYWHASFPPLLFILTTSSQNELLQLMHRVVRRPCVGLSHLVWADLADV